MYFFRLIQVDLIGVISEDHDYFIRFVAFCCDFLICCNFFFFFFCFTLVLIVAAVMRFIVSTVIDLDVCSKASQFIICLLI